MANYIKATNFTAKDALPSGNSGKIIKGTEIDVEFTAIATAISSKADSNSPTFTGSPLAPTANSGTNNTQIATTAGGISLWSGSIASIPSGWALCNGSNGTPDLRNRFVVGAGNSYAVAATGGSADAIVVSHSHSASSSVTDPGHTHQYAPGNDIFTAGSGSAKVQVDQFTDLRATASSTTGITVSTSVDSAGSSGTNANLPPYYALAYIMKL